MDVLKIAEENEVDIIRYTPLMSFGRAKDLDLIINQDEYIDFLTKIRNVQSKVKIIQPLNLGNTKFWINPNSFGCHCGREAIWIDERGEYSPCFFFGDNYFIGNVKKDSYYDLWRKSNHSVKFEGNEGCKNCKNYVQCRGGCRARVYNETGSFDGVDPLCPLKKNKDI